MTELRTQGDPVAVRHDVVCTALEILGIHTDCQDITQVLIQSKRIVVTRKRRDEHGRRYAIDDVFATTTTTIAVRRDES